MPLVSVIIPVYNSEKYIREAIESVLNQTYRDFEIIVIDDGSTDNSLRYIEPYIAGNNIKIITQANSGPSKARNQGIKASSGKYCAFLDSDDIMMPDRLDLQVDTMEEENNIVLVYTDLMTFNEKGIVYISKKNFITPYSGNVLNKLLIENFITTSTVLVRRDCFTKVGYFDENIRYSEDYKMWLSISKDYEIEYLDLPLVKYRYHGKSLSSNKIIINTSAYKVIDEFWKENKAYKMQNRIIYRISMAKRLTDLGNAYYYYGKHKESFKYLCEALKFYPFIKDTSKIMTKIVIDQLRKTFNQKKA